MKGTMKRALAFALLLACLALCGCAAQPPRALVRAVPEGQRLVSADTEGLAPAALKAALYFRYGQTGYLALLSGTGSPGQRHGGQASEIGSCSREH